MVQLSYPHMTTRKTIGLTSKPLSAKWYQDSMCIAECIIGSTHQGSKVIFAHICLSYMFTFCLSFNWNSITVVSVGQDLSSDKRFTERDLEEPEVVERVLALHRWKVGGSQGRWDMWKGEKWVETPTLSMPETDLTWSLIWPRAGLHPRVVMWSLCVGMPETVWLSRDHNPSSKSFIKKVLLLSLVQNQA